MNLQDHIGKKAITRAGQTVKIVDHIPEAESTARIIVLDSNGHIYSTSEEGRHRREGTSGLDIVKLKPETYEVALFKSEDGSVVFSRTRRPGELLNGLDPRKQLSDWVEIEVTR